MKTFLTAVGSAIVLLVVLAILIGTCFAPAVTYTVWGWKDAIGVVLYEFGTLLFISIVHNVQNIKSR